MYQHLKLFPFMIGIILGVVGIFFFTPEKTIIHKYPNPHDKKPHIYKDKNGICYTYEPTEVNCDNHETNMKDFPLSL